MASAIERLRHSQQSARARYGQIIAKRENSLYSAAAACGLGIAEARGHKLPQVMGFSGEITVGVGALVAANSVGGSGGRMLQSFADAMLAVGLYKIGLSVGAQPAVKGAVEDQARAMDALLSSS